MPRFLSLFAGVGGFDLALEAAGWENAGQVENDPFCQQILARRFPSARRWSDVRTYGADTGAVDLLVGGFPCQGASVAGKRLGLTDDRTALFWEILRVQDLIQAPWALLENVPGLRSVGLGHDFPTVVAALAERWPAVGWRTLDSRFFHVAQRRERVFFVCGPSKERVAEVLFELAGGAGDREASSEARPELAAGSGGRPEVSGTLGLGHGRGFRTTDLDNSGAFIVVNAMSAKWAKRSGGPSGDEAQNLVVADPISASEGKTYTQEGKNFRLHNVVSFKPSHYSRGKDGGPSDLSPPLSADTDKGDQEPLVYRKVQKAHSPDDCERWEEAERVDVLDERNARTANAVLGGSSVRRLTPIECERLQGFPDGWTCLCQPIEAYHGAVDVDLVALGCRCSDAARYRALGNAVTVNVALWLGRRLLTA